MKSLLQQVRLLIRGLHRQAINTAFHITSQELRLVTGIVLFVYVATHLANHALGLISLSAAESGLHLSVVVWHSLPGTFFLYGAAAIHIVLALDSIYKRRTLQLPFAELLRIALGFWMPILLIGHAIATRLEFELVGSAPTYARIVASMWASDAEWRQMGLLAPGWLHGCLGLKFAFERRPIWQRLRLVLFAAALLLPVLSALGFITMGRQLAAPIQVPPPSYTDQLDLPGSRQTLNRWREGLIWGYLFIVGMAFCSRYIRNIAERRRRGVVRIAYPTSTVSVPLGWSVLDASRAFHISHASICGGRARCSTCRVSITGGGEFCPRPGIQELATLARIRAEPDVRLACQLRPFGNISVVPLVQAEGATYRNSLPSIDTERTVVVLFCDFLNRRSLSSDHLSQDLMFVVTRYVKTVSAAIRSTHGQISYVGHNSICALFGTTSDLPSACRNALAAAVAIDQGLRELNSNAGSQLGFETKIAVSIDSGHAVMSDIGHTVETIFAAGPVLDDIDDLRKVAAASGKSFAVADVVFSAAQIDPLSKDTLVRPRASTRVDRTIYLSDDAPWQFRTSLRKRGLMRIFGRG